MEDKAKIKQSFQMNKNYYTLIKFLSIEEKGLWIDAIFKHEINNEKIDFSNNKPLMLSYEFVIDDLSNNNRKYNIACDKKSNAKKINWNKEKKQINETKEENVHFEHIKPETSVQKRKREKEEQLKGEDSE